MLKKILIFLAITFLVLSVSLTVFAGEIHDACQVGDLTKVENLLKEDPSLLQAKTEEGKSPLHMATGWGQVEIVEYLLSVGADITARNNNGGTPIHVAGSRNQPECAKILVANGADVNEIRTLGKMTPLLIAVMKSNYEVAEVLLQLGADINKATESGYTSIMIATYNKDTKMVDILEKYSEK